LAGVAPALYAAKALESTIKIISDEKHFSNGKERGASNYIDNLKRGNIFGELGGGRTEGILQRRAQSSGSWTGCGGDAQPQ
jgi:hypothetical protein